MAVDLDDGGIHHGVFHVWLVRDGIEQPFEDVSLHPVAEALEHGVPSAEKGRQITPRATRAGNPQNRLDEAPIVRATSSGVARLAQAMQLHLRPLGVSQNKSLHLLLETYQTCDGNPEPQQALADQERYALVRQRSL